MSIITTGINIVATGVNRSINDIKRFGQSITNTQRQVEQFANNYNKSTNRVVQTSTSLTRALDQNWSKMYKSAMTNTRNQEKELKRLENMYDRTFREIGNKYQSMVMGSVALSMSGVGIMNTGTAVLGTTKTALDQARDFETVMSQIQFYGKRTAKEMESIKKDIFQMGYDLPVKTSEIADSVLSAQKLGYDNVKDATAMAKEASKIQFMSLGKMDGEESLKYISQMRKMIGYTVEDTDKLTDKLTKTADVSASSIDSLWKTIQSSRTAFDSLGGNEDTFLTLAGVMSDRLSPKNAGMALNSFAGGVQMAEKAGREDRGSRGEYYNQLKGAMGGGLDDFNGDILKYIENVATKSKELWGEGSQRKGILQSMFGKSALDLFYAVDAYMGKTGRTMSEMRSEIESAEGHSQKLMDTLMNGSYGTEMRLEALVEQFNILFGTTLRPAFNAILDGLSFVLTKVNQFIEAHPKIAKMLGYGFGIAGLLLTATGATMLFVGGLLAIYGSLNNIIVQLARNNRVLKMLSMGYSSAGAMIRAQMLGPLGLLGKALLKTSAVTFFLWLAWKNDFLRMRTTFTEWKNEISKGLGESQDMFKMYSENSAMNLETAFLRNKRQGGLDAWVANGITKARMLWDGIKDIWKDGTVSTEKHQMLSDAGLLPIIEKVYELKTMAVDFWKGFQDGMKDGLDLFLTLVEPLKTAWEWLSEKILSIFQHFGYFENVNKGIGSQWQQWGSKLGYILGSAIAIRLALWTWVKAIQAVTSPFKLMFKFTGGIWKLLNKMKNIKINPFKALGKLLLPKPIRTMGGMVKDAKDKRTYAKGSWVPGKNGQPGKFDGPGAHSTLPYARQNIDPTTKKPNGSVTYQKKWYQRNKQGDTVLPGKNGASATKKRRGFLGGMGDFFLGQQYVPDEKTDKRGRNYNQITTRKGGVMRSKADGTVKGQKIRTGGFIGGFNNVMNYRPKPVGQGILATKAKNIRRNAGLVNEINFADAGMNYDESKGTKGHRRRSVKAGVKGFWNRSQRSNISAGGNSLASQLRDKQRERGMTSPKGGGKGKLSKLFKIGDVIGDLFKGAGKGIAKVAPKLGKGLLNGLGTVVKKGIPLLFKTALRAIPFLGWAIMAWDAISLIWSNWDAISNAGKWAWDKIKQFGSWAWEGIKSLAGTAWSWISTTANNVWTSISNWAIGVWNGIKNWAVSVWNGIGAWATNIWNNIRTWAIGVWNGIRNWAVGVWNSIGATASSIWNSIKTWAIGVWNSIKSTAISIWNAISSFASGIWNAIRGFGTAIWSSIKSTATSMWSGISSFANGIWNNIKSYGIGIWEGIKSTANGIFDGLLGAFQTAWQNVKSYATNNPITRTINEVVNKVTGKKDGSNRTGLWNVPKENYMANLHKGEMVLTQKESQIMRSLVGSDSNSISRFLLDKSSTDGEGISIAKPQGRKTQQIVKPQVHVTKQEAPTSNDSGTKQFVFGEGSIKITVSNASPSEMKKGAKQLLEEIKRMVELENMKNYRPARPRT